MQDERQNAREVPAEEPATLPARSSGILAFVLEVAMLCAAGLWAIKVLPLATAWALLVVLVPLVLLWGLFLSPQAPWRFGWPVLPLVTHALFAVGVLALAMSGHFWFAGIMAVLTLASALSTWRMRDVLGTEATQQRKPRSRPGGRRAAR
ncbi:YrdB family protein [Arthrobacter sp. JSM 101049]|uniref:YrdB family protein n=1 Tax=Arthrobacter sp. JSM 101049 TaxID=929097 RepID=UPI00356AAB1D